MGYISSLLADPKGMLIFILLSLPGRIMALSAHEFAHAWMSNKCGDPTAKYLGRMTLDPRKHLDPIGTIMMMVLGVGWAKPVPVNPRNYRNYRRDDLKVSIAGVTMNLILFAISFILMCALVVGTLSSLPHYSSMLLAAEDNFVTTYLGQTVVVAGEYYMPVKDLLIHAPYAAEFLIQPVLGRMAGYIYEMLSYFTLVNVSLAIFNLLPVPPLDGYHVLNDLLLKRSLFASPKVARYAYMGLLLLIFCTDVVSNLISFVQNAIMTGLGSAVFRIFTLLGLF